MGDQPMASAVARTFALVMVAVLFVANAMPNDFPEKDRIVPEADSEALVAAGSGAGISNLGNPACADAPSNETALLLQIFLGTLGTAYGYVEQWGLFCAAFIPLIFFCCFQIAIKAH